jgi:hypothetical protein
VSSDAELVAEVREMLGRGTRGEELVAFYDELPVTHPLKKAFGGVKSWDIMVGLTLGWVIDEYYGFDKTETRKKYGR